MGLKTEKSSIRVSMRDFCHEASPFLRVLARGLDIDVHTGCHRKISRKYSFNHFVVETQYTDLFLKTVDPLINTKG